MSRVVVERNVEWERERDREGENKKQIVSTECVMNESWTGNSSVMVYREIRCNLWVCNSEMKKPMETSLITCQQYRRTGTVTTKMWFFHFTLNWTFLFTHCILRLYVWLHLQVKGCDVHAVPVKFASEMPYIWNRDCAIDITLVSISLFFCMWNYKLEHDWMSVHFSVFEAYQFINKHDQLSSELSWHVGVCFKKIW